MRLVVKRASDLLLGGAALIALAPIMGAAALGVWLAMGRPVLFRQVRPGLHGQPFTLYKFRTMREGERPDEASADAARMTGFGRFLRASSIDELPGLWNVVRGDMSLVGPRPLLCEYLPLYTPQQARRHEVRPGITGWAQINGRNAISWNEKFALDVWYVDHQSFRLDVVILLKTLRKVLLREGINQSDSTTMERFRGSV